MSQQYRTPMGREGRIAVKLLEEQRMFEILVIFSGVFALLAAILGWQLIQLRIGAAILFILYGLSAFPFSKQDRHKFDLAMGCIFFILGGLSAIIFGIWWPLPVGVVLGFGIVALFGKKQRHDSSATPDILQIIQQLDEDPEIRKVAQAVLEDSRSKELVSRLMKDIDGLSDRWDRESEKYTLERERIISGFRGEESAALASAKGEQDRVRVQNEYRQKELALGKQLEQRAAEINAILDDMNEKKEQACQHLDPMTIAMLKEHNRAWRDD